MDKEGLSNSERRRSPRLKENFFIFGKLRSTLVEEFKAITQNINAGGLMFETERDILKDSKLELEIYLPLAGDKRIIFSIPVMAKIIWARKIEKDNFEEGENKYRIGIEFLELKEEDRERIAKYVKEGIQEK